MSSPTATLSRDAERVLMTLRHRLGTARVVELAKATGLSKAAVAEVFCDLESEGLVEPGMYRVTAAGREVDMPDRG